MINIFLCDDTPLQLRCIHDFVESYMANKPARIFDYNSPTDLLSGLSEHGGDIAVLDISLGQANGIDLAKIMNAKCPNCQIIFLTAYPEYTSEAYFADHAWFILKKDMTKYLASALDKCLDTLEKGFYEAPAIWVRKRRNRERIPVSEILFGADRTSDKGSQAPRHGALPTNSRGASVHSGEASLYPLPPKLLGKRS